MPYRRPQECSPRPTFSSDRSTAIVSLPGTHLSAMYSRHDLIMCNVLDASLSSAKIRLISSHYFLPEMVLSCTLKDPIFPNLHIGPLLSNKFYDVFLYSIIIKTIIWNWSLWLWFFCLCRHKKDKQNRGKFIGRQCFDLDGRKIMKRWQRRRFFQLLLLVTQRR